MSYVDVQAWDEAYALRACNVVAATILVWEYLIHYDDEVELFWKKRWSFGKCVFLWSRYFSIAFVVGQAAAFLISRPSLAYCLRFFRWQDGATAVQIITSHVVLELRLYAMYRGIRWATIFIPSLAIIESIVSGVLFGLQYEGYNGNEPAPGVTLCADGDAKGKHLLMFFTTTTLTIEITLLSLALYQAWIHRHSMKGGIIRALLRGSVMYFVYLFWIYLGVQVCWALNIYTLNELGTGFTYSFSSVFANRLLIDLRRMYYDTTSYNSSLPGTLSSVGGGIQCRPGENQLKATNSSSIQEYELRTFSESAGF